MFSHLDESIPTYKLRANNSESKENNSSWIQAPLYFDEEAIRELTNEQIHTTLDYFSKFILFGYFFAVDVFSLNYKIQP